MPEVRLGLSPEKPFSKQLTDYEKRLKILADNPKSIHLQPHEKLYLEDMIARLVDPVPIFDLTQPGRDEFLMQLKKEVEDLESKLITLP